MSDPLVTVLMPVRDGARFLAAAIGSILGQSLQSFEFLICDDGSTDATPRILADHAAQDARIRLVPLGAVGLVAALNTGLRLARAPLVARMDADDLAWPERLERQVALSTAYPDAAAIGSGWRLVDVAGRSRGVVAPPVEPQEIEHALQARNCLAHPTMLLRRDAVLAAGGYRSAFLGAEDYDLWLRLTEHHPLRALAAPLVDYREHAGQVTWSALEQRILSELGALAAARWRRAGRTEPAMTRAIDAALLRDLGVGDDETAAALIGGALGAAREALARGQNQAVRAALALLRSQPGLKSRTRLHAAWLGLRAQVSGLRRQRP